jgi:hypothetical protein
MDLTSLHSIEYDILTTQINRLDDLQSRGIITDKECNTAKYPLVTKLRVLLGLYPKPNYVE